jgi:hypothetical protein
LTASGREELFARFADKVGATNPDRRSVLCRPVHRIRIPWFPTGISDLAFWPQCVPGFEFLKERIGIVHDEADDGRVGTVIFEIAFFMPLQMRF